MRIVGRIDDVFGPTKMATNGGAGYPIVFRKCTNRRGRARLRARQLPRRVARNVNPAAETIIGDVRVIDSIRPALDGVDASFT